jgi:hypothetical protein
LEIKALSPALELCVQKTRQKTRQRFEEAKAMRLGDTLAPSARVLLDGIAFPIHEQQRRVRFTRFCGGRGKVRHTSRGAAQAALRSLIRRGAFAYGVDRLNVYHCPRCHAWHTGHKAI